MHGFKGLDHGKCAADGRRIGQMVVQGAAADRIGILRGPGPHGGVDNPTDLIVLDLVEDMRSALGNLVDPGAFKYYFI